MANEVCVFLPWDSEFFGVRIGRIGATHLSPESLGEALAWCRSEKIDCLYFLCDSSNIESIRLAEGAGCQLIDIRITLQRMIGTGQVDAQDHRIRLFREEDLGALKRIARESHSDSRFYSDSHFPRERCAELYETWIERSCRGWANAVLVAELDGSVAGYCTCHLRDGVASIGLIALSAEGQGKSLGKGLVEAAVANCRDGGAASITVATQGQNVRAQRLYQRCGFVSESVSLWYHKWFQQAGNSYL